MMRIVEQHTLNYSKGVINNKQLAFILPSSGAQLYLCTCIHIMHHFPGYGKMKPRVYLQTLCVFHYLYPILIRDHSCKHVQGNHFD